ncbi:MAG: hypothetical protein ACXWW5_04265 [Actinomycetota bacterium]
MDPTDPDEERPTGHPEGADPSDDAPAEPAAGGGAVPNPYLTAAGVVAAIIVVFAFPDVVFVVRLVIAFAIVAAAAYLSILLARRH